MHEDAPGIVGPLMQHPETGAALGQLADALLNTDRGGLTRGERELIAAYVSFLNGCEFCENSHAAVAAQLMGMTTFDVKSMLEDPHQRGYDFALWELFNIAEDVTFNKHVRTEFALEAGNTEEAVHDAILIAAAFNMFNRYVEAAGNPPPEDDVFYRDTAKVLAAHGYAR